MNISFYLILFFQIYLVSSYRRMSLFASPKVSVMDELVVTESDDGCRWVFSYGSNSVSQLQARCENAELQAYPAFVGLFCED